MIDIDSQGIDQIQELESPLDCLLQTLEKVFSNLKSVKLLKEFTNGRSASRVIVAEISESVDALYKPRIIIKFGKGSNLHQEVKNYLSLGPYTQFLSQYVKILEPEQLLETLPTDETLSAIAYTEASAQFLAKESYSLEELCKQYLQSGNGWDRLKRVIDGCFSAIEPFQGTQTSGVGQDICKYYLARWFPHITATVNAYQYQESTKRHLLSLEIYKPEKFSQINKTSPSELIKLAESNISPSREIAVSGLKAYGLSKDGKTLMLGTISSALNLAVDVSNLLPEQIKEISKPNQVIELWTTIASTRYNFYYERLRQVFDTDLQDSNFTVVSKSVYNPLRDIDQPFDNKYLPKRIYMCRAHGDLHPANVLVVESIPVLIDYGLSTSSAPIGIDIIRLFGGVIKDIIAAEVEFKQLARLLLTAFEIEKCLIDEENEKIPRALQILEHFRNKSLGCLDEQSFWLHLYGYAWIGVKWNNEKAYSYRVCFLLACLAYTKIIDSYNSNFQELTESKN